MSNDKKTKVQIHLPADLVEKIEQDAQRNFLKKSSWFEKIAHQYFEAIEKKSEVKGKKVLDLDI